MALRRRRRALRTPWWITASILVIAAIVLGALVRFNISQETTNHEAIALESSSAIAQDLTRTLSGFYTPTIAAEGFVGGVVGQAAAANTDVADDLVTAWPSFTAPFEDYLGDALLDFQLAPEAIVTYSARPERNASALGHNLLVDDARRDQTLAAIEARGPVVSGPIDLIQGGRGLIIRQAVFLPGLAPFAERFAERSGDTTAYPWLSRVPDHFWGMSTVVIDFDALSAALDSRGLPDEQVGLFSVNGDGSLAETIWGGLAPDAPYTAQQELALMDGSTLIVRVEFPVAPWWHYWAVALGVLVLALLVLALASFAYREQRRNQLGFTFSEAISHLTTREAVLERTSVFLSDLYPGLQGRITSPEPHACQVEIPLGSAQSDEHFMTPALLKWNATQFDEVQCTIEVESNGPFDPRELNEIVKLIRRMLGASLGALSREVHLERRASVDHLTGVFNRTQMQPVFDRMIAEADRSDSWLTVACLDVDDFKAVNDTLGHLFGDEVLKVVASALKGSLRASDAVVRFGGDEFVAIALVDDHDRGTDVSLRIHEQVAHALSDISRGQGDITVSLGYVVAPGREHAPLESLLEQADAALYEAKASGGALIRERTRTDQDSIR